MLFTSFKFVAFFVTLFVIYWGIGRISKSIQNWILLIASYIFYGIAEWKLLPLLIVATVVFYYLGISISQTIGRKQSLLKLIGVILGLGTLLYFKYFNFFIESFAELFNSLGLTTNWHTFNIIMPLGVSYFTFKLISYVLEIERGKILPCEDFVAFAIYVGFFPTILAGPIDRPNKFIPQLSEKRLFSFALGFDGVQQIVWGLFKKVMIADNLSPVIDGVWNNLADASGSTILLSLILYTFQMYADFSGYSDMAIGISKLLGIQIARNFNYPFFATNIAEFWKRWHISLTGWLTDYVFIPLNIKFRDWGNLGIILAIIINMVLVGMWHGANWTYAVFGLYQGLLFIPVILSGKMNKKQKLVLNRFGLPKILDMGKMVGIMMLYTIGIILFRAENLSQSWVVISGMCDASLFTIPSIISKRIQFVIIIIALMMICEWFSQKKEYVLQPTGNHWKHIVGWILCDYILLSLMILKGNFGTNQFIYFQF